MIFRSWLGLALAFVAASVASADVVDFAHDVLPILKKRCAKCHTNGTYKAGLSMDTRAALIASESVVVGKANASELISRIISEDAELRMPAKADQLPAKEIAVLKAWIDQGVKWEPRFSFKVSSFQAELILKRAPLPPVVDDRTNPIDRIVDAYWKEKLVERPARVDDARFLRRLSLDVIGLLPSAEEASALASDPSSDRRRRAAARLLGSDTRYAEHWLTFWNDLLRNDYAGTGFIDGGRKQITKWLYSSLLENKRYDAFVRELINPTPDSEGFIKGIRWRGRVNASQVQELQFSQNVSQVFLGINLKCASCHDSFINDWKLDDAYGLAAVVSDRKLEIHRCDVPTGEFAAAKFVYPELGEIQADAPKEERLRQLSELLTDANNGRFSRTIVNRIWQRLMGRGLVEPVDIMSNAPWSESLLDYLAAHLIDNGYDLKKTIELIVTSETYQSTHSTVADVPDPDNFVFRGPVAKRMTAEQFLDSVWQLTETHPKKPKIDFGNRKNLAVRASIVNSDSLMRSLGRPNREQVVTTRPDELTTLQALDLSNGKLLAETLDRAATQLMKSLGETAPEEFVSTMFERALARKPSTQEESALRELMGEKLNAEGIADFLWVLFMLPDFQLVQ